MKKRIIFTILIVLTVTFVFAEQITENIYVRPDRHNFIARLLNDIKFEETIMTFSERDREIIITETSEWIPKYKEIIDFVEKYEEIYYKTKKIFFEKYKTPPISDDIIFFGNWVIYNENITLEYNIDYKNTLLEIRYQLNYDGITLEAYVNIMNKFLNSNYKVARTIANNKVTVQSRHEIPLLYLEDVFINTLKMYGYNVYGHIIEINYGLSNIDVDKMVVVFFYSPRQNFENLIDIMSKEDMQFNLIIEGNLCLAIGNQRSISEITQKWRQIENVFSKPKVKNYPTRIYRPDYVLSVLNQVISIDKNTGGFQHLPSINLSRDIVAVPMFYSNSLLMGFPKEYEDYFDNLLFHLSQMEEDKFNFINIVDIIYGRAEEIASIITQIYSDQSEAVSISTSEVSNSVIVRSTNRVMIREITEIINNFDKKPRQVLIEVLIAEVQLDDNFRYGFEWKIGDQNQQVGFEGLLRKGDASNPLAFSGLKYSLLKGNKFDLFLNAMQTSSEVNILSKPQIMTRNNSLAKIVIGQEIPVSRIDSLGSRTDNLTRRATGGDYSGSDNPQSVWVNHNLGNYPNLSIEYKDVGITLEVTPTISDDNNIMLDLNQIVSEVDAVGLLENPIIRKREASTVVIAENNNTVVIGGMIKQNTTKLERRVPYLSRIPIIGEALFTTFENKEYSTELLIFITPSIVDESAID